jgi:hypothetical protein
MGRRRDAACRGLRTLWRRPSWVRIPPPAPVKSLHASTRLHDILKRHFRQEIASVFDRASPVSRVVFESRRKKERPDIRSYKRGKSTYRGIATLLRTWIIIITIIGIAIIPASLTSVEGQAVTVSVNQDSITVNMNLMLKENLTVLPSVNSHISSTNSTDITGPFLKAINKSIQNQVPTAQLSNFDLNIKTTNVGSMWQVEEDYALKVIGANTNLGSSIRSNLAFIAMNITQPLMIGSADLNGIGPTYLLPALDAKAANNTNLQFYIDGSQTRNAVIPDQTTKLFWLLDFTWVTSISSWAQKSGILDQSSQWTLNLANPRYNLTLGLPSPEGTLLARYVAIYNPSLSITAPADAWVNGNTISFDTPTLAETIMPTAIVAAIIILVITLFLDRRLTGPLRLRKKR